MLSVDIGATDQRRVLGLVEATIGRADVSGQLVQRVPRLGAPELLTLFGLEGLWIVRGSDVHDPVGPQPVDLQSRAIGRDLSVRHGQDLFADLGSSVGGSGHITPLRDVIGLGKVLDGGVGQRLGVADLEAALDEVDRVHVERAIAHRDQLLQAEVQLAGLAPVSCFSDPADVDGTVWADDGPVDAGLESGTVPEDRALVLAFDLFERDPLQAAVGDVAEEHLTGEWSLFQRDRCTR